MGNPWLIIFFVGIDFLSENTNHRVSALPLPFDYVGHGTQYRFQYFVRDESGDYKTQEEAGEGGNARGSYAVEEPDGDLRIVQYNTDLDGSFKAHIKVDHAGKSSSTLQEIDIPAEEMKSLVNKIKKKDEDVVEDVEPEGESSKSYVLGPPKKMSEIIMEQAAAIREIISKEIEAEQKREAEEQRLKNQNDQSAADVKSDRKREEEAKSPMENDRLRKETEIDNENKTPEILTKNSEADSKTVEAEEVSESPVVRVALSPRNLEAGENPVEKDQKKARPEGSGDEAAGVPVKNISFKNRITFYKPTDESETKEKKVAEEILPGVTASKDLKSVTKDEIILYSPHQGDGKTRGG